jgi:long-subunit acyl-CoA synthetase (AMP-forming)
VTLTHRNITSNIAGVAFMVDRFLPEMLTTPGELLRTISYLPLSHMFEQDWHWWGLFFFYKII